MTEQEKRERVRAQAKHLYFLAESKNATSSMLINESARLLTSVDNIKYLQDIVGFIVNEVLIYHGINTTDVWADAQSEVIRERFHASKNSENVEDGA